MNGESDELGVERVAQPRTRGQAADPTGGGPVEGAPSPREIRRRKRIELSREQILDTAEELFSERGYHATGLKEVADRCEFSVGSIYLLFDSKDALYEEVLMRRGRGMREEMARLANDDGNADELLLAMAKLQIGHFRRYPAWGRLTTRVLTLGVRPATDLPAAFLSAYREAIDLEATLVARGQSEGLLRAGDPRALARLFSAMVTAYHAMDEEVSDDPEDFSSDEFLALIAQTFAAGENR
jgi:AcrR family transcriptional regulator